MGRATGGFTRAASRRGPARQWTEERLQEELERFIAGWEHWPSGNEFKAAGRTDLFSAVNRHGGHAEWAARFGLPRAPLYKPMGPPPPIREREWTDERLLAELQEFLGDRPDWPTADEFIAAGRATLAFAVKRYGGVRPWAERLDKTLAANQDRRRYTLDDALREAREVERELGYLPGQRKLRAAGRAKLSVFVMTSGGAVAFGRAHGINTEPPQH